MQLPVHDPERNPESFVLYEDDEWFSTIQFPETQPEESDDQRTHDSNNETDDSADSVRKYFFSISIIAK